MFRHSVLTNTHFVLVLAADHRRGTDHDLPGLSPPAVSVCIRLCQYHRRHPACPGTELPSSQVNLHSHTHILTLNLRSESPISHECNAYYIMLGMIDSLDSGRQMLLLAFRNFSKMDSINRTQVLFSPTFFISCKTRFAGWIINSAVNMGSMMEIVERNEYFISQAMLL